MTKTVTTPGALSAQAGVPKRALDVRTRRDATSRARKAHIRLNAGVQMFILSLRGRRLARCKRLYLAREIVYLVVQQL